jgi:hypothetical protein
MNFESTAMWHARDNGLELRISARIFEHIVLSSFTDESMATFIIHG